MKTLFIMLALMTLLGCAIKEDSTPVAVEAEAEGLAEKITSPRTADNPSKPLSEASEDDAQAGVESTGPLWTIRSEQLVAQSQDPRDKSRTRTNKPQGPFTVRYVLESWALDDHRLMVEVQSNQAISDWQVDFPQLVKGQERLPRLGKPKEAKQGVPAVRTFRFDTLPAVNRLLLTVKAAISGVTTSKTIAVPLMAADVVPKVCAETEKDCVRLLPAKTTY
jgi:hypothetical protein